MFRAAHRSSSGALNCICSLWFIYMCGDWPLSRLGGKWEFPPNKMQPCNRIYYSKVYWRLNMFWAAHHSSSGALNCICSLWFIYMCGDWLLSRLGGKCTSHSALTTAGHHMYVQTRGCKYSLELLMMTDMLLKTCWAFNKLWNNKFYYKVASCWLFLLILHLVWIWNIFFFFSDERT